MTTKEKTGLTDIVFTLDLDEFTWGELEDLESNSPTKIRETMQKCAHIEGVKDLGEYLRGLSLNQFSELSKQFQAAVTEATNPVSENGKN